MRFARSWPPFFGLALFACQFAVLDICLRASRFGHDWKAWLAAASSVGAWMVLGLAARNAWLRAIVSVVAASVLVTELEYYRYYHAFVEDDAIACARSMWLDVAPVLAKALPHVAVVVLGVGAIEYCLLVRAPRPKNGLLWRAATVAIGLVASTMSKPWGPPELRSLWSLRVFLREREAAANVQISLPVLESRFARLPNVLFILNESIRASDYSVQTLESFLPEWRATVPSRIEFRRMHSLASYTSISVNALLSGVMPLGKRFDVAQTPLIFDYLRATSSNGKRVRTLYWSAQGTAAFERADPRSMADSVAFFDDVLGRKVASIAELVESGADSKLAEFARRRLPTQSRPLFLLAHLTDTHAPYHVDDSTAPYRPYSHTVSWAGLDALHNAYKNAILAQDRSVLELVRAFVQTVGTEPYVILFTSDHGEAFGEHQAIHHGQNLYAEQIHVPAWVVTANGAVTFEQEHWLRTHANEPTTHLDFLPTLLDLYGISNNYGIAGPKSKLLGRSLLGPFIGPSAILPMTNCTLVFPCPLQNYGLIRDGVALEAQPWDSQWRCADLATQQAFLPLNQQPCAELVAASKSLYEKLPNGAPNR